MRVKKVWKDGSCLKLLLFILVVLSAPSAFAAEWKLTPAFSVRGEFNDNLTLTSEPHNSIWGTWIIPAFNLQYSTEILNILLDSSIQHVNYFGDKGKDSFTNFYFPLTVNYSGERDQWNVLAAARRDFTLQSELEETGIAVNFLQRTALTGLGGWDHAVTEQLTLNSSYAFNNVTYDDGKKVGLFDRQTHSVSLGGTYDLVEDRLLLQTTGSYVNNHVPDRPFRSQSLGAEFGVVYQISETLQATLGGGPSFVNISSRDSGVHRRSKELVYLGNGSVTKKWERTTITGRASRNLIPSATGQLLESNRVSLSVGHELTETLMGTVQGGFFENTTPDSADSGQISKSQFWNLGSSIDWRWAEKWTVGLIYFHQHVKRRGNQTASGNSVNMLLNYQWSPFSVSR